MADHALGPARKMPGLLANRTFPASRTFRARLVPLRKEPVTQEYIIIMLAKTL